MFVKKLICNEVVRWLAATLGKKFFHTSFLMYFAFIFSGWIKITSCEEALKVRGHNVPPRDSIFAKRYGFCLSLKIWVDLLVKIK